MRGTRARKELLRRGVRLLRGGGRGGEGAVGDRPGKEVARAGGYPPHGRLPLPALSSAWGGRPPTPTLCSLSLAQKGWPARDHSSQSQGGPRHPADVPDRPANRLKGARRLRYGPQHPTKEETVQGIPAGMLPQRGLWLSPFSSPEWGLPSPREGLIPPRSPCRFRPSQQEPHAAGTVGKLALPNLPVTLPARPCVFPAPGEPLRA